LGGGDLGIDTETMLLNTINSMDKKLDDVVKSVARIEGQAVEKDKNCERQNERLESVFKRTDVLDDRLTQVEKKQAEDAGAQSTQRKSNSKFLQWSAIIMAGLVGIASWFK